MEDQHYFSNQPLYKYGFLVVILTLLCWGVYRRLNYPPHYTGDPNGGLIIPIMLLLNHVVFLFQWKPPVMKVLAVLAWGWILFTFFYLFYWQDILSNKVIR